MQFPWEAIFQIIGIIISLLFVLYILKLKPARNYRILLVLTAGCVIWLTANLIDIINTDLQIKSVWNQISSLGIAIVPVAFFVFAVQYTGHQKWLNAKKIIYLSLPSVVWLLLDSTNKFHNLSIRLYDIEKIGDYFYLTKDYGPAFWIWIIYTYTLILISYHLLLNMILSESRFFKKKAGFIILIAAIPIIANLFYLADFGPFRYFDPTPVSLTASILFLLFGITRYNIGEIIPITREALIENIRDGVIVLDSKDRILEINPVAEKLMESDKCLGVDIKKFWPRYLDFLQSRSALDRELVVEDEEGEKTYDVQISPYLDFKGDVISRIVSLRDITDRKKTEKKLKYLSFHDKLTGLYNRAYLEEELKRLDNARYLPISILMGDADGLKLINDTFGYDEGDRLLKNISSILSTSCRKGDVISRWGGDEFAIIFPRTDEKKVTTVLERIEDSCMASKSGRIPPSISMGIASKTRSSQDLKDVIKQAEDRMRRRKMLRTESVHSAMIMSLRKTLQEKSYETEEHIERLRSIAIKLGGEVGLSISQVDDLSLIAVLHDIGKVTIADNILLKAGKLTKKEWETMKKHPEIGYKIAVSSPQLAPIAEGILHHHEWWDGSGYPMGLAGDKIPLLSRIISIVDAYDVMCNGRPYKKPMSHKEVIRELERCSGTQFDPYLTDKFMEIIRKDMSSLAERDTGDTTSLKY